MSDTMETAPSAAGTDAPAPDAAAAAAPPVAPVPAPAAPAAPSPAGADASPAAAPVGEPSGPMSDAEFGSRLDAFEASAEGNEKALAEARKLRGEAQRVRLESASLRTAFEGIDDNSRSAIFGLAAAVRSADPQAVADWLKGSLEQVTGLTFTPGDAPAAPAAGETPPVDLTDPAAVQAFIAAQVKAGLSEHEQAQAATAAEKAYQQQITDTLKGLGYDDPSSGEARLILLNAKAAGGDPLEAIKSAHDARQAELQLLVQQQLATTAAQKGGKPGLPTEQAPAGTPPSDDLSLSQQLERMAQDGRRRVNEAFSQPDF